MKLYSSIKTQAEVRASFWESHPQFKRGTKPAGRSESGKLRRVEKRQNDYNATIRTAFVDHVDYLAKSGEITDSLADRVTL